MPFPGVPWCALPYDAVLYCCAMRCGCCAMLCGARSQLGTAWRINSAPLSRAHRSASSTARRRALPVPCRAVRYYCYAVLCHAVPGCVFFAELFLHAKLLISIIRSAIPGITYYYCCTYQVLYITKIKIHSSCEIEDFVQAHLCKLCDTPTARITVCVSSLRIYVGDSPWNYNVACTIYVEAQKKKFSQLSSAQA